MQPEFMLRDRLFQSETLDPELAITVLDEALDKTTSGELDRLSPFDILTDILELTPKNAFPGLLDMLEERKAKFMNLAGQSTIARENNLDSVHRQLVLAYIDACKRLSGHGDSLILGRLSVFCFQILPFNSKLVLSKTSKVSKVELHNVELDGYKDLWTLINFLQDPLDLFSYDSKMKKYRLASTDREAKRFKEMMKLVDSLLAQFEVIENEAIAARKLREREDKNRKYKEEYEAAIEEDEFHAMYLSDPQVYPYLTKSIHFRQQVLLQLGIILHFLQYVLSGALPKVELSLDDQSVPNINKKVWLNQSITNLKKRIDGTWFSSRNCKSFGLELLFRHELELEKFKNGEFENNIDEGAADDDEMEVTTAPVAISVPFPKTNIERIFGNPPTLDELKDRAERAKEDYVKTVEDYMYELDPQVASDLVTPQDDIEEEYILYNDPVYNWGAARTAVNSKLSLFSSSDIESAQVGKTMLKQWRRYQDTEFTIEKHLTTLKQIPKRDAVMDVDIN